MKSTNLSIRRRKRQHNMAYFTDVMGTGLVLSSSAAKAVQKATSAPTPSERLGTTAPVVAPQPIKTTATQNLTALNNATAGVAQTNQAQAAQAAQVAQAAPAPAPEPSALQKTLQDILGIGTQLEGKGARSLEIQQDEGVFDKKARAKQLENEILSRSQAYEKQIREAMKNPEGKLRSGVAVDVNALQMRSAQELADLSIAYKIANDDYTGAWEIAQAKIDAEFEPLKQRLETLKTYYQLYQNDMTESERVQAEQKVREQEQALAFERDKEMASYKAMIDRENSMFEQQLQQSDPLYQAQLAKARQTSDALRPTEVIEQDGRKLLIDEQTGEVIKDFGNTTTSTQELQQIQKADFINTVDTLKTDKGMTRAVGVYGIGRWTPFTADKSAVNSFIASVEQLRGRLTMDALISAKASGATFGALSNEELKMLQSSASRLSTWARNSDGEALKEGDAVAFYEVSEKEFKKELDKISNYAKLDYLKKGGDPATVNAIQKNGKWLVKNSDGTYQELP